jgi:CHAD domain-containing protein
VHDMRVASRRLRAVLEIYAPCFPQHPYERALREVKAIADALGERRDPDVQLAALADFAGSAADHQQAGLAVLRRRLTARQATGNERLAAALERLRERDLEGQLAALVEGAS